MASYHPFAQILLCVAVLAAKDSAHAHVTTWYAFPVEIRKNTVNGPQNLQVYVPWQFQEYHNGDDCGNPAHQTRKNASSGLAADRRFGHFHGLYFEFPTANGFPLLAFRRVESNQFNPLTDPNVQFYDLELINIEHVKAFWDHYYGNIVYFGIDPNNVICHNGETPKTNCWGYALGYNDIWIQDPQRIYTNDYDVIYVPEDGCLLARPGHVMKVMAVQIPTMYFVSKTIEKNRSSGIYEIWFFSNNLASPPLGSPYYKPKP